MERGQEGLDHPHLDVVPHAWPAARVQADRDVVAHRGRERDERVEARLPLACLDPRQMAVMQARGTGDLPQRESLVEADPVQLIREVSREEALPLGDGAFQNRAAHVDLGYPAGCRLQVDQIGLHRRLSGRDGAGGPFRRLAGDKTAFRGLVPVRLPELVAWTGDRRRCGGRAAGGRLTATGCPNWSPRRRRAGARAGRRARCLRRRAPGTRARAGETLSSRGAPPACPV